MVALPDYFLPFYTERRKQVVILTLFVLAQILLIFMVGFFPLALGILGLLGLAIGAVLLSTRWEIAIGFLMFLIIFVNPPFGPRFELPYFLWPQNIFYMAMITLWFLQYLLGRAKVPSKLSLLGITYLFFLVVCIIGAFLAAFHGNPRAYIFVDLRTVGCLMVFYLVISVIQRKQQITILNGALLLSANVLAIYTIIQELIILNGLGSYIRLIRIYGYGTDIYFQVSILSIIGMYLFSDLAKGKLFLAAIAPVVGLAISLTRGYWLGLGVGILVMFLLLPSKRKITLIYSGAIPFCVFILFYLVSRGMFREIGTVIITRLFSIGQFHVDPSAAFRFLEIEKVLGEFPKHPIFGRGLGATLRIASPFNILKTIEWWSIHNGYIEILHKLGILGLVSYAALSLSFFRAGLVAFRRAHDSYLKGVVAGAIASFTSLLITSFTSGVIFRVDTAIYIGTFFGIVEILSNTEMSGVSYSGI